jgi:hypothetical protein
MASDAPQLVATGVTSRFLNPGNIRSRWDLSISRSRARWSGWIRTFEVGICRPEANIKLGFRQSRKDCYGQRLGMEEWCVRVASLVMRVNYTFMNNSKTPGNGVKS